MDSFGFGVRHPEEKLVPLADHRKISHNFSRNPPFSREHHASSRFTETLNIPKTKLVLYYIKPPLQDGTSLDQIIPAINTLTDIETLPPPFSAYVRSTHLVLRNGHGAHGLLQGSPCIAVLQYVFSSFPQNKAWSQHPSPVALRWSTQPDHLQSLKRITYVALHYSKIIVE